MSKCHIVGNLMHWFITVLPLSPLSSLFVVPVVSLFFFTSFRRYCISGFVLGRLASNLFALFESVLDLSIGLRSANKVHAQKIGSLFAYLLITFANSLDPDQILI